MISYPVLQDKFLKSLFLREKEKFKICLFECLLLDKNYRKKRFNQIFTDYSNLFPLTDLINTDTYDKTVNDLFSLDVEDSLIVEKSYYLLDNIVSFAKREGLNEIQKTILSDKKIEDYVKRNHPSDWILISESHLSQDLEMDYFYQNLDKVKDYCKKYRKEEYVLLKELYEKYKVFKDLDLI